MKKLPHQHWRQGVLVAGLYLVLTLLMTWPVALNLTDSVVGIGGDPWQTMWRFEQKAELLGVPGFWVDEFLGGGEARLINLSVWPWMGLQTAWGQPTAYNLVWLGSFWLAGLGMYYLVRFLVDRFGPEEEVSGIGREWGAFLAGVMYMFLPYHVSHAMGHFGAMQMQWLPWIILLALQWAIRPRIWPAAALAGLLVVQSWSEHHYMLWLAGLAVITAIAYFLGSWRVRRVSFPVLAGSLAFMVVGLGVVVASYVPTIRLAWQANTPLALGSEQTIRFSADLFSFVVASPWHPVWGDIAYAVFVKQFTGNVFESVQFLGILPLLLLIFFHQKIPTRTRNFWLATMAVFFIISLGPRLHLLGTVLPFPLPYAFIDSWPVLSAVRAVARAGAMVGLAASVLVGWVLATQLKRGQAAAVVLLVVLAEFLFVPVPMQSAQLPQVYERVAEAAGETVVELPAATNYALASRALYASNYHQKEVLGHIALERAADEDDFLLSKRLPAVKQLLYLRTTDLREDRKEFWGQGLAESLPDALAWVNAAGVLIHVDSLTQYQSAAAQRFLEEAGMRPEVVEDAVWFSTAQAQWQVPSDGVVVMRGEGFSHVDYDPERDTTFVRTSEGGEVLFVNVTSGNKRVRVSLRGAEENKGQAQVIWRGERIGELLGLDTTNRDFDIVLPPGEHRLELVVNRDEPLLLQDPQFVVLEGV